MKLKLTFDQLSEEVRESYDVEIEGIKYNHVAELDEDMDDNGRYVSHIYQRESDGKYFRVDLFWIRYGYEDYSFEKDYNDGDLTEVEKREVTITRWVNV